MMLLYEEDGDFCPADFGLKVGDIVQIVGIGGGGGGSAGMVAKATWSGASNVTETICLSSMGGSSGEFKSFYVRIPSIGTHHVYIGKGGAGGKSTTTLTLPTLEIQENTLREKRRVITNYLGSQASTIYGKDGGSTSITLSPTYISGGGYGYLGDLSPRHGGWHGGAGAISNSSGTTCFGGGGAGGFIPGIEFRGGHGISASDVTYIVSGTSSIGTNFINTLAGHSGHDIGSYKYRYQSKYGGAASQPGSSPGGAYGGTFANSTVTSGGGGGGYGAGGGGGSARYASTSYACDGGAGADGCLLIFF